MFAAKKMEVPTIKDPVCLYKGNEAKIFSGVEAEQAMKDGWKDSPGNAPKAASDDADVEPKKPRGRPRKTT